MKKRVLSVLLALAMCLTAFSGIAFAQAPLGKVETNIDKVDNMLSGTAIDEQKALINSVAEGAAAAAPTMIEDLIWNPETDVAKADGDVPYIITETMLAIDPNGDGNITLEENQTLSYFVLLKLQEMVESGEVTETNYPNVYKLITGDKEAEEETVAYMGFNGIDDKYDTTGLPLSEAFNMFDGYGDALTELYVNFMKDEDAQIELFAVTGVLEEATREVVTDQYTQLPDDFQERVIARAKALLAEGASREDAVKNAAKEIAEEYGVTINETELVVDTNAALRKVMEIGQTEGHDKMVEVFTTYLPVLFQQSVEEYVYGEGNGSYLEAYRNLMMDDRSKKEVAIVVGHEVTRLLAGSGIMNKLTSYMKAKKPELTGADGYLADANNRQKLFNSDSQTANAAIRELVELVAGWVEEDAVEGNPANLEDGTYTDMKTLVDQLALRDLSASGLVKSFEYILDTVDNENIDFSNIWYNLALGRLTKLEVLRASETADAETGEGSANIDVAVGNQFIQNKIGSDAYLNGCLPYFTLVIDPADAEKYQASIEGSFINYVAPGDDPVVLHITIYRGEGEVAEFDVDRYVSTASVELPGRKPITPPEPTINRFVKEGEIAGITLSVGTPYDPARHPGTVTLYMEEDIDGTEFDIIWPEEAPQEYLDKMNTHNAVATIEGTYVERDEFDEFVNSGEANVDGKVQIDIKFVEGPVDRSVEMTNKTDFDGKTFDMPQGGKVEIPVELNVDNVPLVVLAVAVKDQPGSSFIYTTLSEKQANTYTIVVPEDLFLAQAGDADSVDYTVIVGNQHYDKKDEATFTIKKAGSVVPPTLVYKEVKTQGSQYFRKGTSWANVEAGLTENNKTMSFRDAKNKAIEGLADGDVVIDYNGGAGYSDVTVNNRANTGYDPNSSDSQYIIGKYALPAGFEADPSNTSAYKVDGYFLLTITRSSGGGGGGNGGGTIVNKFTEGTGYDNGNTIRLVGESSNTTVIVDLIGPDGKVIKTVSISRTEFINGYDWDISDIVPLEVGTYTLLFRSKYGDEYDKVTFTVGSSGQLITTDIFNKVDHFNYLLGFEDGTVRPDAYITRDEVAAIMFRLLTDDVRTKNLVNSTDKFSDLPEDIWSMTAFATLNSMGIYRGRGDGTMGVGQEITRAEFAALCSRFAVESASNVTSSYTDIAGNWAENEIKQVTAAGWFQGDNNQFRPNDKITRAEVVTVMNRILGRDKVGSESFDETTVDKFSDLKADAWYYVDMVEATVAHQYEIVDGKEVWKAAEETVDWTVFEK